ncbi:uncharacterized protein IUM83_02112 [Phytophthora cinnamomi]|uniref:uncharacterized protein n=1 Tax=Phytophthora cinnamomi TaxID=4785 RepID=UPI00355A320D|nr:hypothetical protein IUM83_02112 [Phytophthora cinnamomi]
MDLVDRLLHYVADVPRSESVDEVKDQLSAYTHRDLRVACLRLGLQIPRKLNKKGGFISALVSHWRGEAPAATKPTTKPATKPSTSTAKTASKSSPKTADGEVLELASFVDQFPPDGTADELRDQLNGCKSRTLRSTCVLLEMQPHRTATKANFVSLLVSYWQDAAAVAPKTKQPQPAVTPKAPARVEPKATPKNKNTPKQKQKKVKKGEMGAVKPKRSRDGEEFVQEKPPKKERVERSSDERFEEEVGHLRSVMASSLEKAKVVKEWASAIEILSRVDGSAESISSIRALIDGVVDSAADEL